MKARRSLAKNLVFNIANNLLNILYPVILLPYILRVLGPEAFGRASWAISFSGYFVVVAAMGIPQLALRGVARMEWGSAAAAEYAGQVLKLQFSCAFAATLLYTAIAFPLGAATGKLFLLLPVGALVLFSGLSVDWLLSGTEAFGPMAVRNLVVKLISLGLIPMVVTGPNSVTAYLMIIVMVTAANSFWNIVYARRSIAFCIPLNRAEAFRLLKSASAFNITALSVAAYQLALPFVYGLFTNDRELGYYMTAFRVIQLILALLAAAVAALLPRVARAYSEGSQEGFSLALVATGLLGASGAALTYGIAAGAPVIVSLLGGDRYVSSVGYLVVLSLVPLASSVSLSVGQLVYVAEDRENGLSTAVAIGASISLALLVLLSLLRVPSAASWAYLSAEAIIASVLLARAPRGRVSAILGSLIPAVLSLCIALAFYFMGLRIFWPESIGSHIVLLTAGFAVFLAVHELSSGGRIFGVLQELHSKGTGL